MTINAWEEEIVIATYEIGKAEKNPLFLEKRIYQGSSGVVYPYAVIDKITDEKTNKIYKAVFLENEYLKIMILPELGGRIQMAYDKIKQRHFVYYNQVIKPALVGLTGPWISGGIEFNWPQHHRPSTFMPVDYFIDQSNAERVTVWVNEIERMSHQKAMISFTLYAGKAYLEIHPKIYNPTALSQTFLWWVNPAVAVNEHYQSVFPPDVHAVFDHGKRDVSTFPIATGTYYKVDYSKGVDISNYKNIPVPTSFMAIESEFNFIGGYENDSKAGMLHIANHHIAPGKKQWTWGNGDFGRAWDKNLTDQNGPYIELMAGVYTDNQPDFAWLQPYEEKSFFQYFLPYRELGIIKNASKDLLLNIEASKENHIIIKVFATSLHSNIRILLTDSSNEHVLLDTCQTISPEVIFIQEIKSNKTLISNLKLNVFDHNSNELLSILPSKENQASPKPLPAQAALLAHEIDTCENLYLTGLHLEQYRHATYLPTDYYLEALRRNPNDIRNNNAMGVWFLRRGKWNQSEMYFNKAIESQNKYNSNPNNGETYYNLGVCLKYQDKLKESYKAFYKSTWNSAQQDAAFFSCAQISLIENRLDDALYEINQSISRNTHNHKAMGVKVTILRKLKAENEALEWIDKSLKSDPFNYRCWFEKYLITNDENIIDKINSLMHSEVHNYHTVALEYIHSGSYTEALLVLQTAIQKTKTSPMTYYYMSLALHLAGKTNAQILQKAESHNPDYCFPNNLEAILALQYAQNENPFDAKAPYYLGNLWYDKRQYTDAIVCWEKSIELDPNNPTALRNLALASYNQLNMPEKALDLLQKAFLLNTKDARILYELDQLKKRLCYCHQTRLDFLEQNTICVLERDDLFLEKITLYNQIGEYEKALEWLQNRKFHPWEGGEGKIINQYQIAKLELAKKQIAKANFRQAIELINQCLVYPENLGEGKLLGANESDFYYFLGYSYAALGENEKAQECWQKATFGKAEITKTVFYNDQKPYKIFYQALSFKKLGNTEKANSLFNKLIEYAQQHINQTVQIDYFAVSLPDLLIWNDDIGLRNRVHCLFLEGLGNIGLKNKEQAINCFAQATNLDINQQDLQTHNQLINDYYFLI